MNFIVDGSSYAFAYLNVEEKDPAIQELWDCNENSANKGACAIEKYQFLRVVNLSKNGFLSIDKVKCLTYLYELYATNNQISDIDFLTISGKQLKFLQKVDLTGNKITKLAQIQAPRVTRLTLDENEISECSMIAHDCLRVLSLNKNKLTNCKGLANLEALEELSLQENETLTSLAGLEKLPKLKKLNLTGSKVDSLAEFPDLPALEELVLDGNDIKTVDQLSHLKNLKCLRELSMGGCPVAEEKGDDFKKEVLIALMDELPRLNKVNGDGWDAEALAEAKAEKEQRIKDAIEAAKQPAEGEAAEGEAEAE